MDQDDGSRLREFRQLKREIRGSSDHMVVGIDIAKDHHVAFLGTGRGKVRLKKVAFDNTKEGFEKLLFHTGMISSQHLLKKIVFGMEPTADYHKPLGEYLTRSSSLPVLRYKRTGGFWMGDGINMTSKMRPMSPISLLRESASSTNFPLRR